MSLCMYKCKNMYTRRHSKLWFSLFIFNWIIKRERDSLDREVMELKKSNTVLEAGLKSRIDELQEYQKEVSTYYIRKYLRYNAHSDWSKVCNMSVYIRGQRFCAHTCTFYPHTCTFYQCKIFYKSNIKWSLVSVHWDINILEVVEHSRSQRNTQLHLVFFSNFSHALGLPLCLYHII
jgi:hypothetical protein